MKNTKITTRLIALLIMTSLISCSTACAQQEEEESETEARATTTTTEETTEEETEPSEEETTEETTEETSEETTEETEAEVDEHANRDRQACSNEVDDARYMAYFQNEYPAFAESTWIESNYEVMISYVDLDGNGADELLIGVNTEYGAGVFCVITEVDGEYHETDVYDWMIQHGAAPGAYLGNGHFCGHISNGNNYESESRIDTVFEYNESLQNCGIIARYSTIYHFDETVTCQLYTLAGDDAVMLEDIDSFTPGNTDYIYESEAHELLDGEEYVLETRYTDIEDSYRTCEDPYSVLDWRPVTEVLG